MNKHFPEALLIDMDGVLRFGDEILPGTAELVQFINENAIPASIVSNSTGKNGQMILDFFNDKGIDLGSIQAFTALDATLSYIKSHYKHISFYTRANIRHFFEEWKSEEPAEAVIVADLAEEWDFKVMNEIFREVMDGADLVAMQINRFWKTESGLTLDAGTFIKGLEYATGKEAIVLGKPSKMFFQSALTLLGLSSDSDFWMLGDDVETDVNAGMLAGGKACLVMTGKTSPSFLKDSGISPDVVVEDLPEFLELLKSGRFH